MSLPPGHMSQAASGYTPPGLLHTGSLCAKTPNAIAWRQRQNRVVTWKWRHVRRSARGPSDGAVPMGHGLGLFPCSLVFPRVNVSQFACSFAAD